MLVIGDRAFWEDHGALGGKLAARIDTVLDQAARWRHSADMRDLVYDRLIGLGAKDLQLGLSASGYPLDARLSLDGAPQTGLILDAGAAQQAEAGRVLRQQIRRIELIASADPSLTPRRLPAWLLYASDEELAAAIR